MDDTQATEEMVALETPASDVFIPPSVDEATLLSGASHTYLSHIPDNLLPSASDSSPGLPCVLGVDEAGRGPVLGPMVYGVFFLPIEQSDTLLRQAHHFDDSKALTPATRSALMRALCTPGSDLHAACGWATASLSARDIGAGMLRANGAAYNLNAQAMDATVALIQAVMARGVDVREIYVDTVGPPLTYQRKLERIFPTASITVAKKADSLYPSVSAASVCAKVTRDAALEVLYRRVRAELRRPGKGRREEAEGAGGDDEDEDEDMGEEAEAEQDGWGSGYPSDARCVAWLKRNMHPFFGWGPECRFSWGTVKDMLEAKGSGVRVEWPLENDGETARVTDFFVASNECDKDVDELGTWFGAPVGLEAF